MTSFNSIQDAIIRGDIDFVMSNVTNENINCVLSGGRSFLRFAFEYHGLGDTISPIFNYLIGFADVNLVDGFRASVLHRACSTGRLVYVSCLLKHGADPNIATLNGYVALDVASGPQYCEIVRLLIDYGAKSEKDACHAQYFICRINFRNQCRAVSILILGLRKFRCQPFGSNGRDVCTLIMKHLWSMRFEQELYFKR
jgi:ankyrin repeat protein